MRWYHLGKFTQPSANELPLKVHNSNGSNLMAEQHERMSPRSHFYLTAQQNARCTVGRNSLAVIAFLSLHAVRAT